VAAESPDITLAREKRDYEREIVQLLSVRPWLTVREIAAPKDHDPPGVGMGETRAKEILEADPERFEMRTGEDAKVIDPRRPHNARVWALRQPQNAADVAGEQGALPGGVEESAASLRPPLGDAADNERTPGDASNAAAGALMTPNYPTQHDPGGGS
jgi:hypothetical protein